MSGWYLEAKERHRTEHHAVHPAPVFGCDDCIAIATPEPAHRRPENRDARRDRDRQKTADAHFAIERGVHPYTRRPLRGSETCGSCGFFRVGHRYRYFKCAHPLMPTPTNGPATDIRKTWPACDWWKSG